MSDPLSFLNIDNPLMMGARYSGLAGQKIGLMEKYKKQEPNKMMGAIGGAMAGVQLAANMGAFNGPSDEGASSADYGSRTAPTIENSPSPGNASAINGANIETQMVKDRMFEIGQYQGGDAQKPQKSQAQTDYDSNIAGKSTFSLWEKFMSM